MTCIYNIFFDKITYMEIEIIKFLQSFRSDFLDGFFKIISIVGSFWGFIILFICLFVFCDTIFACFFGGSYGLIWGFNQLIKFIVNRPRPYIVDSEIINIFSASGSSFPSGHTTSTVVMAIFLIYLIWRKQKGKYTIFKYEKIKLPKWIKVALTIFLSLFVVLLIISRMYLGQHFLSDVLSALFISTILSLLCLYIYEKREKIYLYFKGRKK